MKTLQRAIEVIAGASISFVLFDIDILTGGVITCLMLVLYLPVAAQFDGDSDER